MEETWKGPHADVEELTERSRMYLIAKGFDVKVWRSSRGVILEGIPSLEARSRFSYPLHLEDTLKVEIERNRDSLRIAFHAPTWKRTLSPFSGLLRLVGGGILERRELNGKENYEQMIVEFWRYLKEKVELLCTRERPSESRA